MEIKELYNDKFFSGRHRYNWRAPIVCGAIRGAAVEFTGKCPVMTVDVGCAVGDLVSGFLDLGIDAIGFEGSECALPYIVCPPQRWFLVDMGETIKLKNLPRFCVATCFEVAEHIAESKADTFCDNMVSLSDVLVMSACPPHPTREPTKYHLNEQKPKYWNDKFKLRGYTRHKKMEVYLKEAWEPWRRKYGIAAYYQNLLCYTK